LPGRSAGKQSEVCMFNFAEPPDRGRPPARRRWLLLSVALLLLGGGCRSLNLGLQSKDRVEEADQPSKPVPNPAALPSAYSFRIAPYVFVADFEVPKSQPLFKELAQLRDQVSKELLLPPGTAVVQVYLFENRDRYEKFMKLKHPELPIRRAFFIAQPRGLGGEDLIVYTYWGDRIRQDLRHELTHALLHSVIRDVPLWLDEGLAEYFELPPENQGVNAAHVENLRRAMGGSFKPDLARLEKLEQVDQMNPAEYREAWAWVHLMLRTRPEARTVLLSYLQQLRGTRHPGKLATKLKRVYPDPEKALEQQLAKLESQLKREQARASTAKGDKR